MMRFRITVTFSGWCPQDDQHLGLSLQVVWYFAGKESNVETQSMCVHIRWMIRRDMPSVLGIENSCFEFACSEDDFIRCLRQRNCIGMVAEQDNEVVGFMIYELHKNRLHILNFAVHPEHRRTGVGQSMVNKLLGKLSHERRNRIMLEVRETNLEAQLFFKSIGFRAISVLRDFYDDTIEDAYLMQYRYQPSAEELAQPHNRISKLAG
jgi:ribosomal-protein-alanine N-acetyltransferase